LKKYFIIFIPIIVVSIVFVFAQNLNNDYSNLTIAPDLNFNVNLFEKADLLIGERNSNQSKSFSFTINNHGSEDMETTPEHFLEYFDGNNWRSIPSIIETSAILIELPANSEVAFRVNINEENPTNLRGLFRIRKSIWSDLSAPHDLTAEFELR